MPKRYYLAKRPLPKSRQTRNIFVAVVSSDILVSALWGGDDVIQISARS